MLSNPPFLGALRTALHHLPSGNAVAQAYALHYLAQAVHAAEPYTPLSIVARPQPTAEAVSLTMKFTGGYRLQVTTHYPQLDQREAPKTTLCLFHNDRLQYAQVVERGQLSARIARALSPLS